MQTKDREPREETNEIRVSGKGDRNFTFFVYLAKKRLENFKEIHFHAIGNACPLAVQAVENLCRHSYATLSGIRTETIEIEGKKRAKLVISIEKSKEFDKVKADWEKGREERGKAHEARQTKN